MKDEMWKMRDGTLIAVSDMSEDHVRNALRMVIRRHRRLQLELEELEETVGDVQDRLSADSYNALSNPNVFFPLIEGGRWGSAELAARYDPRKRST